MTMAMIMTIMIAMTMSRTMIMMTTSMAMMMSIAEARKKQLLTNPSGCTTDEVGSPRNIFATFSY